VAGGGGSPVKGAINLVPQAAPSAPDNGDIWTTAAAVFARISGATKQLATQDVAGPTVYSWGGFGFTPAPRWIFGSMRPKPRERSPPPVQATYQQLRSHGRGKLGPFALWRRRAATT